MRPPLFTRAFSMIEVVIAVGIFTIAAATILALLPSTTRQAAGSRDIQTAARLPDAVKLALERAVPAASFATFTSANLVAARDGTQVRPVPGTDDNFEQYFLIEVSPLVGNPALRYDPLTPLLALQVRVSWPYRPPGPFAPPTQAIDREQFTFPLALRP